MELNQFLVWLFGGGGAIVAVSFVAERIPQFQALTSQVKQIVMFVACALVSCGAYAVVTFVPANIMSQIVPWFGIVASTFVTLFVSKNFHQVDKQQ
jgi:hypothetical protein